MAAARRRALPTVASAFAHAARERRLARAGVPELARSFAVPHPTASMAAASFVELSAPVTFRTAIRILENSGTHQGLIFELGDASNAVAAWVDDDAISFRAGGSATADRALATFTTGTGELPVGRTLDLVFAVLPGHGVAAFWASGQLLARDTASGGAFPAGWAGSSVGAFAAAAQGALPADVLRTGAPDGFAVVTPLSVYSGQAPHGFYVDT